MNGVLSLEEAVDRFLKRVGPISECDDDPITISLPAGFIRDLILARYPLRSIN